MAGDDLSQYEVKGDDDLEKYASPPAPNATPGAFQTQKGGETHNANTLGAEPLSYATPSAAISGAKARAAMPSFPSQVQESRGNAADMAPAIGGTLGGEAGPAGAGLGAGIGRLLDPTIRGNGAPGMKDAAYAGLDAGITYLGGKALEAIPATYKFLRQPNLVRGIAHDVANKYVGPRLADAILPEPPAPLDLTAKGPRTPIRESPNFNATEYNAGRRGPEPEPVAKVPGKSRIFQAEAPTMAPSIPRAGSPTPAQDFATRVPPPEAKAPQPFSGVTAPTRQAVIPKTGAPTPLQNFTARLPEPAPLGGAAPELTIPGQKAAAEPKFTGTEGTAARWTNEKVLSEAAQGNRVAISQVARRGLEPPPNMRYVAGDPDLERAEYSPREVTRFAPDGTPIRQTNQRARP